MHMQRALANAALALALAASLAPAASFAAQPKEQNGVTYINGGVGTDEQNAMQALKADYNLRLTFATKQTGAYRSDVQLDIADAKGAGVLSVANTGPMFFAKLPPGTYRISAAAEGKTFKRSVKLGNGAKEMTLHWENDSPDDPGVQE
jgi:tripartite-type tricarboxylate transporter receptor subunit TctC